MSKKERECICSWSIGLGLKGWSLYPCVPVGARGKEPSAPTELEAPPLTVVMLLDQCKSTILCWITESRPPITKLVPLFNFTFTLIYVVRQWRLSFLAFKILSTQKAKSSHPPTIFPSLQAYRDT